MIKELIERLIRLSRVAPTYGEAADAPERQAAETAEYKKSCSYEHHMNQAAALKAAKAQLERDMANIHDKK